jgi:hypothetical protein
MVAFSSCVGSLWLLRWQPLPPFPAVLPQGRRNFLSPYAATPSQPHPPPILKT